MIRGRPQSVLLALVLFGLGACAPAPPPPKAPPPPPPDADRISKQLESSLAALALPDDLMLAGRWKNPSALLARLATWSGGTLGFEAWLRTRLGEPSRPIDLNAPIELIVVLEREHDPPQLGWALSVGLGPGAARKGREPLDVESPIGLSCAEGKALGSAPARMVCSPSDDQLARLLPHATRALPLAPVGDADISISLRAAPLATLESSRLRALAASLLADLVGVSRINDRFELQWAKVVDGVARELAFLAEDLDGSSIELALGAKEEALELSLLAPAAAGRSTLGQLVVGSGASGLAPTEFWQAHEASDEAGFFWAFQAAPIARWREPLAALLGTLLDYRGVPNRLEQQARDLVTYLPMPRGPVIHASGGLPPPEAGKRARAPWLEQLGWQLYSVRGNFSEYQYYVGALSKSFNDEILGPQFVRLIKSGFGPKWAPARVTQRRPSAGSLPRGSFVMEVAFATPPTPPAAPPVPAGAPGTAPTASQEAGLGTSLEPASAPAAGSAPAAASAPPARATRAAPAHATTATSGAPAAPAPPEWYAVFVPDEDDGVRIACGADERFLISLLAQPAKAKASTTLAGRAGLGSLHEHRILAGGFFSLAGLEKGTSPFERLRSLNGVNGWAKQLGEASSTASLVASAPHRGVSPIVYTLSQPSDAWLHLTTHLSRETLEDLLFLIGGAPTGP